MMFLGESIRYNGRPVGFLGAAQRDTLQPGDRLNVGEELRTGDAKMGGNLIVQPDGNIVLYTLQNYPLWASGTRGKPIAYLEMQTDGNLVAYDSNRRAYWSSRTNGNPGAYAVLQNDGNFVVYKAGTSGGAGNQLWHSRTWNWRKHEDSSDPFSAAVKAVEKIPVVGHVVSVVGETFTAPLKIAARIASGERLDHVAMDALKDQLKSAKDLAPYAATVVSLVPGIGTGAAAAIAAGAALAEGKSIDEAAKAAIRNALPGGALAQAAFDTAMKAAAGERIDQAALESARNLIPEGPARSAFDVGIAVSHGEKIQNAIAQGLVNMAPGQIQSVLASGANALATTPGLADVLKQLPPGAAEEGFKLAAGLLSQAGMNEKGITAVRNNLTSPDLKQGFDAALKAQEPHIAWLKNVTSGPALKTAPRPAAKPAAPAPKAAPAPAAAKVAGRYGPYPKPVGVGSDGATTDSGAGATPWVAGGILIAAAVGLIALEKKFPEPFRRSA